MTKQQLLQEYNKLQNIYGEKTLDSITWGGKEESPEICFVFMNPTGRNITADKKWTSIKSPWIGTKNVWKLFFKLNMFDEEIFKEIMKRKPNDWDYTFAEKVYDEVSNRGIYITNLAKCTQVDARPLSNSVFKKYRKLLLEELNIVKPKKIVTFGNQVSAIFLERNISVSKERKNVFEIEILGIRKEVLPTYYPVGQGQRNMNKAVEDIKWFLER